MLAILENLEYVKYSWKRVFQKEVNMKLNEGVPFERWNALFDVAGMHIQKRNAERMESMSEVMNVEKIFGEQVFTL